MRAPDWTDTRTNRLGVSSTYRAWVMPDFPPATTLRRWLLHCPGMHAAIEHWCMSVASMREVPPALALDRTHEIAVYPADPRLSPHDPDKPKRGWLLSRPDQVLHLALVGSETDALALQVCEELVKMCMNRELHPDSDFRQHWQLGIGAAIIRAAKS